jgi:hypothetical protein
MIRPITLASKVAGLAVTPSFTQQQGPAPDSLPSSAGRHIDALRSVSFVMKDGLVFKRDGVMTPERFLHGGPVNGWYIH